MNNTPDTELDIIEQILAAKENGKSQQEILAMLGEEQELAKKIFQLLSNLEKNKIQLSPSPNLLKRILNNTPLPAENGLNDFKLRVLKNNYLKIFIPAAIIFAVVVILIATPNFRASLFPNSSAAAVDQFSRNLISQSQGEQTIVKDGEKEAQLSVANDDDLDNFDKVINEDDF